MAVPVLSALHTPSHRMVNTTFRGSNSYNIPFGGVHLGSERTRSLPRRNSWDMAELRCEPCRHREHSHEHEESLPGEADVLVGEGERASNEQGA